ncbi:hypothetical protein AB0346_09075 [Nocardia beijingensis]|uniref:hypothetical protein n=1 Tax=Nocardia beijingensis TaxID=95162 RepID=UPI00344BC61F
MGLVADRRDGGVAGPLAGGGRAEVLRVELEAVAGDRDGGVAGTQAGRSRAGLVKAGAGAFVGRRDGGVVGTPASGDCVAAAKAVVSAVGRRRHAGILVGTVSALASTAVLAAGPSGAEEDSRPIGFNAHATSTSAVIEIDAGSLTVEDGVLRIAADDGRVLAAAELAARVDDFVFPIAAEITDRTVVLTPQLDTEHATYRPVALPFEDQAPWRSEYDRERDAWTRLTSTIATGVMIGTLVGGIGGAATGCVLGGLAGATIASATIIGLFGPFLPAALLGCLGGVVAIGPLGAVAGQLLISAPIAILAAVQYFTTITAPMPT